MNTATLPSLSLSSRGQPLGTDAASWGELSDSSHLLGKPAELQDRMREEGYLFIRNFFPRTLIEQARLSLLERLGNDSFDPAHALADGVLLPERKIDGLSPDAAKENAAIRRVVFGPEIRAFYERLFDCAIRHFDYIWVRTMGAGYGTQPHCDIVYMGRGTHRLHTAWIPYGDVTYDIGGLMILEKSHQQAHRIRKYLDSDVDTYCENIPGRDGRKFNGALSSNPVSLREKFGGRWLSAEYRMGDLLTFRMDTVHASLDNQSNRIRLSTDTRYQPASDPADERWIGENPIAHGPKAKRGLIC